MKGMGISVSVGPFAEGSLDEALGLAVGFWSVGSCEAMFEAESGDGDAHEVRAVAGAVVGVETLGVDAVLAEEGERGVEEGDGTGGRFVWEELGESEAGVIVDGDVEIFPADAADMIGLAIAGDAVAEAFDAGQLFDVEMNEFARRGTLVALDGRWWGELSEAEAMPAQQAGDGGFGQLGGVSDLKAWKLAQTQREHAGHAQRVGGSRGTKRT